MLGVLGERLSLSVEQDDTVLDLVIWLKDGKYGSVISKNSNECVFSDSLVFYVLLVNDSADSEMATMQSAYAGRKIYSSSETRQP